MIIIDYEKIQNYARKIENNKKVKDNILLFNKELHISLDYDFYSYSIISDDTYLLMMQLGIPIGAIKVLDENKNIINEYDDKDPICNLYMPINSMDDYFKHLEKYGYCDFMVNPTYMNQKEVRNIAYLLSFANDLQFFDVETMNKMQFDLIDNVPLDYYKAMKIFKKYYTNEICDNFINNYDVDRDRFYYLSGLSNDYNLETALDYNHKIKI